MSPEDRSRYYSQTELKRLTNNELILHSAPDRIEINEHDTVCRYYLKEIISTKLHRIVLEKLRMAAYPA